MPNAPYQQILVKQNLDRIDHPNCLSDFITEFGPSFDCQNWMDAIDKMHAQGMEKIDTIVKRHLSRYCPKKDVDKLETHLAHRGITTTLREPKQLTAILDKWAIDTVESRNQLLNFADDYAHQFNFINWAAFASKLYQSVPVDQKKLTAILGKLTQLTGRIPAGEICQIIGGLVPFIEELPMLGEALSAKLLDSVGQMKKEELIMVLHALRRLPHCNQSVTKMLATISVELFFNPSSKSKLEVDLDLFAVLVHTSGEHGYSDHFDNIKAFIRIHQERMSSRVLLEILEGLYSMSRTAHVIVSEDVIDMIIGRLIIEMPKISDVKSRGLSLSLTTEKLASMKFVNSNWIEHVIQQAQNNEFPLRSKIYLCSHFAAISAFRPEECLIMKQFVNGFAAAYFSECYVDHRMQYPQDGQCLRRAAEILNKERVTC